MLEFFCFVFFLSSSNLHLIQIQKAVTKHAAQRDFLKAFGEANQTLSLGFYFLLGLPLVPLRASGRVAEQCQGLRRDSLELLSVQTIKMQSHKSLLLAPVSALFGRPISHAVL